MARPSKPITTSTTTIKFLCSYGGKILPRYPDGKLRYYGGETRVLAVDRSISFSELLVKLGELCGTPVALRCQLPTEDLDALISITCDEDLVNLVEEYDPTPSTSIKIRAFLTPSKKSSPPRPNNNCVRQMPQKRMLRCGKSGGNLLRYACENSSLVHNGNSWQL
ncbi:Phox/Bem1p [Artemisia annua]|uniref:Phox/Bem1p n=1 Tax=Artemisia annua TaxID=35608 RepID=A0A2U1NA41_ARTAN|nr:Phox/Bem1p [Artemisia annua]